MKKQAFTMLELVLVIVVLGILAALTIPRLDRDLKQEAADNILAAIRYTQHLALADNKHKFDNPKWQQRFWHIYFGTCDNKKFYAIGSDDNMENSTNSRVDFTESAIDPANGKHIWAQDGSSCEGSHSLNELSPNIFIEKKYGLTTITPSGGCTNQYIGFDHLGRPYKSNFPSSSTPDYAGYLNSTCTLTFTMSDNTTFQINIEPETGYAYVVGQEDL
jgi:prepilin-type N-terminal cleavage/methylation domain-containing protein